MNHHKQWILHAVIIVGFSVQAARGMEVQENTEKNEGTSSNATLYYYDALTGNCRDESEQKSTTPYSSENPKITFKLEGKALRPKHPIVTQFRALQATAKDHCEEFIIDLDSLQETFINNVLKSEAACDELAVKLSNKSLRAYAAKIPKDFFLALCTGYAKYNVPEYLSLFPWSDENAVSNLLTDLSNISPAHTGTLMSMLAEKYIEQYLDAYFQYKTPSDAANKFVEKLLEKGNEKHLEFFLYQNNFVNKVLEKVSRTEPRRHLSFSPYWTSRHSYIFGALTFFLGLFLQSFISKLLGQVPMQT